MAASEAWAQLPGESGDAYARFLIFRNLGPRRSLRRAYHHYLTVHDGFTGGKERLHVPGQWCADSADHFWIDRAAAWDVRNLTAYGARLASLHVQSITSIAEKNARYARKLKPGDDGWAGLVASVKVVGEYLTPEVMRGLQDRGTRREPVPAPGPDGLAAVE
jgi:hypothetical protein